MISVICVYNDERKLHTYALKHLATQNTVFELIVIDNTQKRFTSAAEALNFGGRKASGDYLMFMHQDVDLCSGLWLEGLEELLNSLPHLGVAGVAGMSDHGSTFSERCRNVIFQGPQRKRWGNPLHNAESVQTLDECLIIIPAAVFKEMPFDGATCSDWHLYAVDYCLSARERGEGVFVIPKCIYHRSTGEPDRTAFTVLTSLGVLPDQYYRTLENIIRKHKDEYEWIHTSNGSWSTKRPLKVQRAQQVLDYIRSDTKMADFEAWIDGMLRPLRSR